MASLDPSFSGDGKQTTDFGGTSMERSGWRSRGTARSSRAAWPVTSVPFPRRLRARPLRLRRVARPELLRRRQADHRLRGPDGAGAVAVQEDGKIVAVGTAGSDFALARYNPNGSLDPSFSGDGKQTTDFGAREGASGVAIQGDGKMVVAGRGGTGRATSRSLATTPTGHSTRASPATASKNRLQRPTTGRAGWRSRRMARSSRWASRAEAEAPVSTSRSPATTRTGARHQLLRRRQADN